jgi:hypothetical protein
MSWARAVASSGVNAGSGATAAGAEGSDAAAAIARTPARLLLLLLLLVRAGWGRRCDSGGVSSCGLLRPVIFFQAEEARKANTRREHNINDHRSWPASGGLFMPGWWCGEQQSSPKGSAQRGAAAAHA